MKQDHSDGDEGASHEEDMDPEFLERELMKNITNSCVYVMSITASLEETAPKDWNGSTGKIKLVKGLLSTLFTPQELMKYYIVYVFPLRRQLKKRDERFFLENNHIYPKASEEDIKFFKDLWRVEGAVTSKEKKTMWKYFDAMLDICHDWQKTTAWFPPDHPEDPLMKDMPKYAKVYWEKKAATLS